jgi:hypothetical protein
MAKIGTSLSADIPEDKKVIDMLKELVRETGIVKASIILDVAPMTLQKAIIGGRLRDSTWYTLTDNYRRWSEGTPAGAYTCAACHVELSKATHNPKSVDGSLRCENCDLLEQATQEYAETPAGRRAMRAILHRKAVTM